MLKKENKKESASTFGLDLKLLQNLWIVPKSYQTGHDVPQFQKFDGRIRDTHEHIMYFLVLRERTAMFRIYAYVNSIYLAQIVHTPCA